MAHSMLVRGSSGLKGDVATFDQAYAYILHRPLDPAVLDDERFCSSMRLLKREVLECRRHVPHEWCTALRRAFEYHETLLETTAALAGRKGPISRTFEFAKKEGEAAGLNEFSRVLFIGSGPYPESAMAYAHAFGCEVHGLDCCPVAVAISSKIMPPGTVFYGKGENFDLSSYTHVFVAILVKDKASVIENCLLYKGKTVVIRTVDAPGDVIYEPVSSDVLSRLTPKATVRGQTIMHSIIATT